MWRHISTRENIETTPEQALVDEIKHEAGERWLAADIGMEQNTSTDSDESTNAADHDYMPDDDFYTKDTDFLLPKEVKSAPIIGVTTPGTGNMVSAWQRKLLKPRPKRVSVSAKVKLQCSHCPLVIQGKQGLKTHINRVHLNVRKAKCQVCPKSFWSNCVLQDHMLAVHTRKCNNCNQYVVESTPWTDEITNSTTRHVLCVCGSTVMIVSKTRSIRRCATSEDGDDDNGNKKRRYMPSSKYACAVCHKVYASKYRCQKHQQTHSDVKSCVCHLCGVGFRYAQSLSRHMKNTHDAADNVCIYCGASFATDVALITHVVKFHDETNKTGEAETEMATSEHLSEDETDQTLSDK